MQIIKLSVGQLQANCYLVKINDRECIIIDPGDDAEYIIDTIQQEKLIPKMILATHGHFDHIMAVWQLQVIYQIPFFIDQEDEFLVKRMQQSAQHFIPGIKCSPPPSKIKFWQNQNLKNFGFEIIKTPGHTPGSVSYFFQEQKTIFVGDVVFANGMIGRTDFKYCDSEKLRLSIERIFKLPGDIMVYPGHGEIILLSDLKKMF